MSRIAYVNGRYLPLRQAVVHVEDRGYQFGDAVYEVCEVRQGRLVDERRHLERLKRSLDALQIRLPMLPAALGVVLREVIACNRIGYGIVYLIMFPVGIAQMAQTVRNGPAEAALEEDLIESGRPMHPVEALPYPEGRAGS